jgi:glycosyltransferase involved in cell wall biosynthesis
MKILMSNALFPPDRTGSSIFTQQLGKALSAEGATVQIVTSAADPKYKDDTPTTTIRLPVRRLRVGRLAWDYTIPLAASFSNLRRVDRLIQEFLPDAIICHGQIFDLTWLVAFVARRKRVPCFVVVHTAIWHERLLYRLILRVIEGLFISPLSRYSRVSYIAVDKWTHENTIGRLARGRSVRVVPTSVEPSEMIGGDGERARTVYKLGDGPILLSLGHVISLRNRVALVRALPSIIEKLPSIKLVIAGEIKDQQFLTLADELGVVNSIVCLGSVPHSDIKDLLAAATIEAHDLQGLGLGITTLEAMAAGVPIVAWASDDNYPGYSLRQHTGIRFIDSDDASEVAEACLELMQDEAVRDRAIASQRDLIDAMFTPRAIARKYLEVLSS